MQPPTLDLVAGAIFGFGVEMGIGVAGLLPAERLAEQILGQVTGWIIGAANDAS